MTAEEKARLGHWNYVWMMKRSYVPIAASDYVRNFMLNDLSSIYGIESPLSYGKAQMQYGAALNQLLDQYVLQLITQRDINFDAMFQELVNTWNSSGGAQITQEMNELYRR